jgi:hypothetical protein
MVTLLRLSELSALGVNASVFAVNASRIGDPAAYPNSMFLRRIRWSHSVQTSYTGTT